MTKSQRDALLALRERGGEGVISKTGRIIAGGVQTPFLADTWLRLITTGHVEARGPMRIGITALGMAEAVAPQPKINPASIRAPLAVSVIHPGAE